VTTDQPQFLALDLADACDKHHPGDLPAVLPHTVTAVGDGQLRADYACPAPGCGHRWFAGWDADAAGWPIERTQHVA
jgi:hypothetical protein